MVRLRNVRRGSLVGRGVNRVLRFGLRRGLRSIEVRPEDFRRQLADKHGLWVPNFSRMHDVPLERLDAIAKTLIRDAERLALAEGAGFGLGGMITLLPDAGLLTAITLRLIQRLCLLYGFETRGRDERVELWLAAATATGVDYGKDLVEKQMVASLAIGGALNFSFVRGWGRRVQRNLREKHVPARASRRPVLYPSPAPETNL